MNGLISPIDGTALAPDGAHALIDDCGQRWPVIDEIAYLRAGSRQLADAALECLDAGDREGALILLLAENDPWWDGPVPPEDDLVAVIRRRDEMTLREAMDRLGYGRVGTYFAHRWSDATYLSGLALLNAYWQAPSHAFELACGIGHFLRALAAQGVACTGSDIVFSKLWLARHFVVPADVRLVCMDAEADWPFAPTQERYDLLFCHDAFYFLRAKEAVAQCLRGLRTEQGVLVIGHIHNADWPNLSSAAALRLEELVALFPEAALHADEALTHAFLAGSTPASLDMASQADTASEAFAIVEPGSKTAGPAAGPVGIPPDGARLRRNPLLDDDGGIIWPSERYEAEYGPRASYGGQPVPRAATMSTETRDAIRRRDLLDLPERW